MLASILQLPTLVLMVAGAASGWLDGGRLAAGGRHTCALAPTGEARCWGSNRDGQLGDGTREDRRAPTPVIGLGDALELVAGSDHTCARLRDRSVVCWGASASGQLGDGARSTASLQGDLLRRRRGEAGPARPEPAPVVGLGPADALVAARSYTCALVGGDPWCWGRRVGSEVVHARPTRLAAFTGVDELAVGGDHLCARTGGAVSCLSEDPRTGEEATVPAALAGITDAIALASGEGHLCVLHASGRVTCTGHLPYTYERDRLPGAQAWTDPTVIGELTDAVAIASGASHACALRRGGEVRCWGMAHDGQLGHGLFQPWRRPVAVVGLRAPRALAAGYGHTCAIQGDGAIACWGSNGAGQLGWAPPPVEVPELTRGRSGRDDAAWQLREILRASASPVIAWTPDGP